jgi:hypothetical protein
MKAKTSKYYIKSVLIEISIRLGVFPFIVLGRKGFLKEIGWIRTVRERLPITKDGKPIPWFTYSAINFLQERLDQEMNVFEYGSGYSTLWWASHVSWVVSCEHDKQWYEKIKKVVPPNVDLHYVKLLPGGDYCQFISKYKDRFDVVVIDGKDRVNCAKNSLSALKRDGVIVWDNSDRLGYQEGYNHLLDNGYKRIDFYGMGPINPMAWCTSIFYKQENCLEI